MRSMAGPGPVANQSIPLAEARGFDTLYLSSLLVDASLQRAQSPSRQRPGRLFAKGTGVRVLVANLYSWVPAARQRQLSRRRGDFHLIATFWEYLTNQTRFILGATTNNLDSSILLVSCRASYPLYLVCLSLR